jgi:hypothetical protein
MDTWSIWILQEALTHRQLGGEAAMMEDTTSVSTYKTLCSELTSEDILDARIEAYQDLLDSLDPELEEDEY